MLARMTLRPKWPKDGGGAIRGPPVSSQCRTRESGPFFHVIMILPDVDDSAPCVGGIGGKLMKRKGQGLRGVRLQRDARTADLHLVRFADPVRRQFLCHQRRQVCTTPSRIGKERVGARQRLDAPFDRRDIAVDAVGARQPDDRLDHRQRIAGPMIDLAREQILPLFGLLACSDFHRGTDHAHALVFLIEDARPFAATQRTTPSSLPTVRYSTSYNARLCGSQAAAYASLVAC